MHYYNSTQYCNTETVFINIPLPPDQHHNHLRYIVLGKLERLGYTIFWRKYDDVLRTFRFNSGKWQTDGRTDIRTDRQTDRQTDMITISISRVRIAVLMRRKNHLVTKWLRTTKTGDSRTVTFSWKFCSHRRHVRRYKVALFVKMSPT